MFRLPAKNNDRITVLTSFFLIFGFPSKNDDRITDYLTSFFCFWFPAKNDDISLSFLIYLGSLPRTMVIILCFSQDLIGYSDSWEFFLKNFSSQIPFLILYLLCQFLDLFLATSTYLTQRELYGRVRGGIGYWFRSSQFKIILSLHLDSLSH